jgi:hypothetical protein
MFEIRIGITAFIGFQLFKLWHGSFSHLNHTATYNSMRVSHSNVAHWNPLRILHELKTRFIYVFSLIFHTF